MDEYRDVGPMSGNLYLSDKRYHRCFQHFFTSQIGTTASPYGSIYIHFGSWVCSFVVFVGGNGLWYEAAKIQSPRDQQVIHTTHSSIFTTAFVPTFTGGIFGLNCRDSLFNVDPPSISGLLYEVNYISHQYVTANGMMESLARYDGHTSYDERAIWAMPGIH